MVKITQGGVTANVENFSCWGVDGYPDSRLHPVPTAAVVVAVADAKLQDGPAEIWRGEAMFPVTVKVLAFQQKPGKNWLSGKVQPVSKIEIYSSGGRSNLPVELGLLKQVPPMP